MLPGVTNKNNNSYEIIRKWIGRLGITGYFYQILCKKFYLEGICVRPHKATARPVELKMCGWKRKERILLNIFPMEWNIGCSGYHYLEWKRTFYPEDINQRKWFEYYCTHFNTIELNATYYKFPRVEALKRWYDRSPRGFLFTVKAPRHVTHHRKFNNARRLLDDFNDTVREGLEEKLGCVLFQFPSNFHFEPDKLARVVDMLDTSVRSVVEFRHPSWWNPVVYEALAQANIIFCSMSHPQLPGNVIATTDTLYYRFHGVPHLYNSKYDSRVMEQVAQEMFNSHARRCFAYFNNAAEGNAIFNAKQLQDICELVH